MSLSQAQRAIAEFLASVASETLADKPTAANARRYDVARERARWHGRTIGHALGFGGTK